MSWIKESKRLCEISGNFIKQTLRSSEFSLIIGDFKYSKREFPQIRTENYWLPKTNERFGKRKNIRIKKVKWRFYSIKM